MAKLEKNISQLRSIYQLELERKDAFCEEEKEKVASELLTMTCCSIGMHIFLRLDNGKVKRRLNISQKNI